MGIRIDGEITGAEIFALRAALVLTDIVHLLDNNDSSYEPLTESDKTREVFKFSGVVSGDDAKHIGQKMRKAYDKLNQMTSDQFGIKTYMPLFMSVLADVEASSKRGSLDISPVNYRAEVGDRGKISALLNRFGLPSSFNNLVYKYSDNNNKKLLIVYLDGDHFNAQVQQSMAQDLQRVDDLKMVGLEGAVDEIDFPSRLAREPAWSFEVYSAGGRVDVFSPSNCIAGGAAAYLDGLYRQNISVLSSIALECLFPSKIITHGVEGETFKKTEQELRILKDQMANPSGVDLMVFLKSYVLQYERQLGRGKEAPAKLMKLMHDKDIKVAALIYGEGHYYEILQTLKAQKEVDFLILRSRG